jgi:hypothetical protein
MIWPYGAKFSGVIAVAEAISEVIERGSLEGSVWCDTVLGKELLFTGLVHGVLEV